MPFDAALLRDVGFPILLVFYLLWMRSKDDKRSQDREQSLQRQIIKLAEDAERRALEYASDVRALHESMMETIGRLNNTLRAYRPERDTGIALDPKPHAHKVSDSTVILVPRTPLPEDRPHHRKHR